MHKHWIREFSDSPKPAPLYDMYYGNDYSEPVIVCLEREDGTRYIPPKLWAYSKVHGGWVEADLREGMYPENYEDQGYVVAWHQIPDISEVL